MAGDNVGKGFEVRGDSIGAVLDGFRQYPIVAIKHLVKCGLVSEGATSPSELLRDTWYSLERWLSAHHGIAQEIGYSSLYTIGKQIPANAPFPDAKGDVVSALKSINIAYHLNHRKDGEVMYNSESGRLIDGIGSYRCENSGPREIFCTCDNPYPCDLDLGLIEAIATRVEPLAATEHHPERGCRKQGAKACTYVVSW